MGLAGSDGCATVPDGDSDSDRGQDGMLTHNSITLATQRMVAPVQGMHRSISARWFAAAGAPARPVRQAHNAVSNVVYGSIRAGGAVAGILALRRQIGAKGRV